MNITTYSPYRHPLEPIETPLKSSFYDLFRRYFPMIFPFNLGLNHDFPWILPLKSCPICHWQLTGSIWRIRIGTTVGGRLGGPWNASPQQAFSAAGLSHNLGRGLRWVEPGIVSGLKGGWASYTLSLWLTVRYGIDGP